MCTTFLRQMRRTQRGRGHGGNHGIVQIPGRPGDWVFFVSFGRSQGDHDFDEGISEDGVLRWQSQPRQGLDDRHVQEWLNHDEYRNSIYLFLRTAIRGEREVRPFTYLGALKYVSHDQEREKPVHILWQLLDWPIDQATMDRMQLELDDQAADEETEAAQSSPAPEPKPQPQAGLVETTAPSQNRQSRARGTSTREFRARQYGDRSKSDAANRALGKAGELLVVDYEKQLLVDAGRQDLADKVVHVAVVEGDGAGYDVRSYQPDGSEKYVEVKTTQGPKETDFFLSANELRFSESQPEGFYLYRVFNYRPDTNSGQFYVVNGSLSELFELSPTQYRLSNLNSDVNESDFGG